MYVSNEIAKFDFDFENSIVTVIANRNCPEIKLGGLNVGPFHEGNEYEIYYWVALELKKAGIVRFREGKTDVDVSKLVKTQWIERVQTTSQISQLPEKFYPMLRRCISELKREATKGPEKMSEYERVKHLARDLVSLRLRKIISIATASTQTQRMLVNLTGEEKVLYKKLNELVNDWRRQILYREGIEK